ncbi:hypothetical protein K435DRAFT_806942 [Dendrothele bispora CBS 962.96]|uniref:Uncharacterized protein n=1 Tax=Dendrothele bispora (strain CBS 962.96) TaxID=1314807 RepID=A0A4S8L697_DENBC|nr:hypothetical protein K435DRAFT_806942 [Dendrothele bispora CBS 962.96]
MSRISSDSDDEAHASASNADDSEIEVSSTTGRTCTNNNCPAASRTSLASADRELNIGLKSKPKPAKSLTLGSSSKKASSSKSQAKEGPSEAIFKAGWLAIIPHGITVFETQLTRNSARLSIFAHVLYEELNLHLAHEGSFQMSRSKGHWRENIILLASYFPIPSQFLTAWSRGQDPDPLSFRSPSPDLPTNLSKFFKGKGTTDAESDNEETDGEDDEGDEESDGMTEAVRRSRIDNVRQTQSTNTASSSAGPSQTVINNFESITISDDSSVEDPPTFTIPEISIPSSPAPVHLSQQIKELAQEFASSSSNPFSTSTVPRSFDFGK